MGNAAFLLIPVAVAMLGLLVIGVKMLFDRPRPYDAMNEFQRGLDALAPPRRSSVSRLRRNRDR